MLAKIFITKFLVPIAISFILALLGLIMIICNSKTFPELFSSSGSWISAVVTVFAIYFAIHEYLEKGVKETSQIRLRMKSDLNESKVTFDDLINKLLRLYSMKLGINEFNSSNTNSKLNDDILYRNMCDYKREEVDPLCEKFKRIEDSIEIMLVEVKAISPTIYHHIVKGKASFDSMIKAVDQLLAHYGIGECQFLEVDDSWETDLIDEIKKYHHGRNVHNGLLVTILKDLDCVLNLKSKILNELNNDFISKLKV